APLTTTIRPPFGEPANAETARSISPASDSPIGFNSTSNEFATAVYHDVGTAEHYTTWPGYCLKALRVNSRTRLAFAHQALKRGNDTALCFALRAVNRILSDEGQPNTTINRLRDVLDEPELNRALGQNSRMILGQKKPPAR